MEGNKDHKIDLYDLTPMKNSIWVNTRKIFEIFVKEKNIDERLDDAEEVAGGFEDLVWWIRMIVVLSVISLYALDGTTFMDNWQNSCNND